MISKVGDVLIVRLHVLLWAASQNALVCKHSGNFNSNA